MSSVTKEQIELILKQKISNFKEAPGSNEGDNVASILTSVIVTPAAATTADTSKSIPLLYKSFPIFPFENPGAEERLDRFFKTEHAFYKTAVPLLEKILATRESSVPGEDYYSLPVPKYYENAHLDPASSSYLHTLWLQDLRPEGYKMMDKFIGLNFEETSFILAELGKFHAITYTLLRNSGEKLFQDPLARLTTVEWFNPEKAASYRTMISGVWENSIKLLEKAGHSDWVQKLKCIKPKDAFDLALRAGTSTDKKYFPLIIHGDFWTNNILLKFDETSSRPIGVKFVDFQLTRRGNIYDELIYFILTSTTPDFRSVHLTSVLETYYNSFIKFLAQLNCPKPIGFTFGSFYDEFHSNMLSGYVYMTFAIPLQLSTWAPAAPDAAAAGEDKEIPKNGVDETAPAETITADTHTETTTEQAEQPDPFVQQLYRMLEKSPRAIRRLEELTEEMIKLNVL